MPDDDDIDDPLRGIYDPKTRIFSGAGLMEAISSRGYTLAQFSAVIRRSRTTLHRALSGQPAHPATVAMIREGLRKRPPTRPLMSRIGPLADFGDRVACLLVDSDGHILATTPALCKISGYSDDELTDLLVSDLTHPQDMARASRMLTAVFSGKRPHYYIRKRCIARDGSIYLTKATAFSLDPEGEEVETVVVMLEPLEGAKARRRLKVLSSPEQVAMSFLAGPVAGSPLHMHVWASNVVHSCSQLSTFSHSPILAAAAAVVFTVVQSCPLMFQFVPVAG